MRSGCTCRPSTMLRNFTQHVVREQQRVGEDDALDRRVRDVALVPQRDVLEPGLQVAAQHPGETAELLALHGLRLCGIALEPFWRRRGTAPRPRPPRCAGGGGSRARTPRRSHRPPRTRRAARRAGRGRSPAWPAPGRARAPRTRRPRPRIDVGVRADRARQLADRDGPRAPAASRSRSRSHLQRPERELAPNVIGSAWIPCVRPTIGVSRCSWAWARDRRPRASAAASRSEIAAPGPATSDSAVSTTSYDVSP